MVNSYCGSEKNYPIFFFQLVQNFKGCVMVDSNPKPLMSNINHPTTNPTHIALLFYFRNNYKTNDAIDFFSLFHEQISILFLNYYI